MPIFFNLQQISYAPIHLRYIIKHPEDIPPRLTQKKFIIYIAKKETPVKIYVTENKQITILTGGSYENRR